MSEFNEEIRGAISSLVDSREEAAAIEAFLEEQHPHEYKRLSELRSEIPALQEKTKELLRGHGSGGEFAGHRFRVQGRKKTNVDTAELLERAEERGDIETLREMGFLEFKVVPGQLERLPSKLRAIYTAYIEITTGSSAVYLPKELS